MRFGASIWPWRWDAPYTDGIRRIGQAGFRATELIAWSEEVLRDYYTPSTIKELRSVLADEDVQLSQFVHTEEELTSADPAIRQGCIDRYKLIADVGAELGSPIINTVVHYPFGIHAPQLTSRPLAQEFTVEYPKGLDWDGNYEQYVESMREVAEYVGSLGMKFSIEPHPFRYAGNTDGLLRLIERVDSPHIGVNWDPSHTFPAADMPHASVNRFGKRLIHCHFSDNDGMTNAHWRPGKGKIDWRSVMEALKEIEYDGVVSLEFEDIPGVSRGSTSAAWWPRNPDASEGFINEYKIALDYLTELAEGAGLNVVS